MLPFYYQVLEIPQDASDGDVRHAYRRLAKLYHPDVNREPGAAAKFIQIQQAYEVLSDPQRRARYDYYALRYTHRQDTFAPETKGAPAGNRRSYPYTGYGGKVHYRTADPETYAKEQKVRTRDMLAGLAVILFFLSIPFAGVMCDRITLRYGGVETWGEYYGHGKGLRIYYTYQHHFIYDENLSIDFFTLNDEVVIPGSMPLSDGDKFLLRHPERRYFKYRIFFDKPDKETFERFCDRIYTRLAGTPFLDSLRGNAMEAVFTYTLCDSIYARYGTRGLADLYFSGFPSNLNPYNNEETWHNMTRMPEWQPMLLSCRKTAARPE